MADAEDLILPVPERLAGRYLVPTDHPPADLLVATRTALADRHCRERTGALEHHPLRAAIAAWLDSPHPGLRVEPIGRARCQGAPVPDDGPERLTGADQPAAEAGDGCSHAIGVVVEGAPGWPPVHDWTARAVAAILGVALDATVVDQFDHRRYLPTHAAAGLPDHTGQIRLADWVVVLSLAGPDGPEMVTCGLRRFGLPELRSPAPLPSVGDEWGRALTALAGCLLRSWQRALRLNPRAAFVHVPATITVAPADVAAAFRRGRPAPATLHGPARVRLSLDPQADGAPTSYLVVHPPLDWPGSPGEHMAHLCAALFGRRPTDIRRAAPSREMDTAIAAARRTLAGARHRFESGALGAGVRLLVKYALPAAAGTEYMWAYVTSWRDPYRILAVSAADAIYQPTVRAGRPVVVDTAAVVDWAVEHADRGIIEGDWTGAALDDR